MAVAAGAPAVAGEADGEASSREFSSRVLNGSSSSRTEASSLESSQASSFAMRRTWRPPSNAVVSHVSTMTLASSIEIRRWPSESMLASLCARASRALVSFQQVGLFGVAARLALFPRRLLYVPMQVLNPEITHKWEGGRRAELAEDMRLFLKLELGLGILLLVPLALLARPLILLVSTPIGVAFGLREAWRLAGPGMAVLMALLLAVVSGFIWMTVRTIRRERAAARPDRSQDADP